MPYCVFTWGHCDKASRRVAKPVKHICGKPLDPREKHVHDCAECGAKPR